MKPLILKDVAKDVELHESTVSRVTTNKYVHTPQGVYELKYFFSSGIKGLEGDVSSQMVKNRISAMINAENPERPLSDQALVKKLKGEGVDIARRTVAKYREALHIPSSTKRKKRI
jgi:RNA polymerase sigma-54 factor